MNPTITGTIVRITGPVIAAIGLTGVAIYDVVYVGHLHLVGEVIRLAGDMATIQVYDDTAGLRVGEPVAASGGPFMVELGPGLLGAIFDGVQRPLPALREQKGDFIARGGMVLALDRKKMWEFEPVVNEGDVVSAGSLLGVVKETLHLEHRVLVPPQINGIVKEIRPGRHRVDETVAVVKPSKRSIGSVELTMLQRWPTRRARPYATKLDPEEPLITGQRIIDTFYPLPKGGTAVIPGGFGTGKTVLEQNFAKWANADIIVYVGCGERGNEMCDVLEEFPKLKDPYTDGPLMERTILIANTSNMPVAAREASIYTGVTIAEYFRDMGYDVALMADSTSRWGEALREVSGRLEEMPGEEGYPAYLLSRLADFYERSGRVTCSGNNNTIGSITLIGAVSPPGGDFSEPMTQNSLRVAGAFWGLDTDLARRRHFPAINWSTSYSLYKLDSWFNREVAKDWSDQSLRGRVLLQRERELQEIVQLVGADALAEEEKGDLAIGRMLREDFLQQSGVSGDAFCPPVKTYWMLKVILTFYDGMTASLRRAVPLNRALAPELLVQISRMRNWRPTQTEDSARHLIEQIETKFQEMV